MWWHADLPAALPGFGATSETPSEPEAQGEFLLGMDFADPVGRSRRQPATRKAGAERRALRRKLRDQAED